MRTRIFVIAVIGSLLWTGGVHAEEVNPVVGKVGDFVLREADLERLISNQSPETQQKQLANPEQRAALVRELLLAKAVATQARKEKFDRKPEVKEQLSYVIDQYLAQEYLRKVVIATVVVTDEEMKKYYLEHEKDFRLPATIKVRHIFFAAPQDASPEVKAKARAKTEEVLLQLRKGEEFAKLAREFSEDADSAAKGGELGYLSAGKTNSEEFEKAAFALKAGEISAVVETPFGYHLIKIDERKEARTATYDEARDYIRKILKEQADQQAARDFLEKLAKENGLEITGEKQVTPPAPAGESAKP